jgi:glycine/D-amino acid oxidase-like deaminating enzyme
MESYSLDRRTLLKLAGMMALNATFNAGCAAQKPVAEGVPAPVQPEAKRRLARVQLSPDRFVRVDVALRPFRPSGFVVRGENLGKKTVIHNYGHGGAGITLSWGTAHLALGEARKTGKRQCAVLGCGAVGLATARLMQRAGWQVTIYARDLPPDTFSNVPGGQWSPFAVFERNQVTPEFERQYQLALRLSLRTFQSLVGDYYGVRWIDHYILKNDPINLPDYYEEVTDLLPGYVDLAPGDHPFGYRHVRRMATIMADPPIYLNALVRDFQMAGGRIVPREFFSRAELLDLAEPVIVNCTGLGAQELFADKEMFPVKGQLIVLLPQPDVDYMVGAGSLYMHPRKDGILLGGTVEPGVSSLDPNPQEIERVMQGQRQLFGGMKSEQPGTAGGA